MVDGSAADLDDGRLAEIYAGRFDADDLAFKRELWQTLCREFFQRYVSAADTVLDLGAGTCEFINAIDCAERIAVDLNPDTALHARGARVVCASSTEMQEVSSSSVDVVFSSNFFEHLPSANALLATLTECRRTLRPGGTIIVLVPNIRYLAGRYWDYLDHSLPLTHLRVAEALSLSGFQVTESIPRFLPYTVKDRRIPRSQRLVRLYLRARPLWPLIGRQMLVVARAR